MSHLDEAFYQQDEVRMLATVTLELATLMGASPEPQQAALDQAEAALAELVAGGHPPPADLAAKTAERIDAERVGWAAIVAELDELLALPADVQAALGVDVAATTKRRAEAQMWVDAIDAVWPEGG